ncbi:MAG TPA: VWA domain-containing protein [Candidatus Wallbacteria bacterium]|nr:VWA domain-containing protein [Candidatus Wallbacteria bacterium]
MMAFRYPEMLVLLIIPCIMLAYRMLRDSKRGTGIGYANFSILKTSHVRTYKNWLSVFPAILKAVALCLLVVALARPQFGEEKEDVKRQGIDIFIALDVSGSMSAEDLKPDRITAARELTSEFIKKMTDHRLGMVIFAGRSMTLSPLTIDIGIIIDYLSKVKVGEMPIDGTAIGDAISNCIYKFKDEKAKSKVIILLTDGENNTGNVEPMMAAKIARDRGIKIYTIGIGSKEGAPIPVTQGGRKFYMRNPDGTLSIPKIDEKLLQEIAALTEGRYFRATDEKKLREIYDVINKLEKSEIITSKLTLYSEKAHYPLFMAFVVMLAAFLIEHRVLIKI